MILGQLLQTGRRFCECRSQEFIPHTDAQHTVIAYTADDRFSARSIDEQSTQEELQNWLSETKALAYVLISLNYNPHQKELPPPIGENKPKTLTITATTPEAAQHATFEIAPCDQTQSMKLTPSTQSSSRLSFTQRNFFEIEEETEPVLSDCSKTPFFGERILVYS